MRALFASTLLSASTLIANSASATDLPVGDMTQIYKQEEYSLGVLILFTCMILGTIIAIILHIVLDRRSGLPPAGISGIILAMIAGCCSGGGVGLVLAACFFAITPLHDALMHMM